MSKAQNGARIKAWAGPDVGSGIVRNITFQNFVESEVDNPVVIDQVRLSRRCFPQAYSHTCINADLDLSVLLHRRGRMRRIPVKHVHRGRVVQQVRLFLASKPAF